VFPFGGRRESREETPDDEFVDLPFVLGEFVARSECGRIDRGVVGRFLVAARRRPSEFGEFFGVFGELVVVFEYSKYAVDIDVVGVKRCCRSADTI